MMPLWTFIGRDKQANKQDNINRRVTSTLVTNSFEGQECYNVYWITYLDGQEINREYLYSYCEGGGGGGVPVTPPPAGGGGSAGPVENLMSNPYNFTPEQRAKLQSVIDQMLRNCVG
jgi:hypothetical protein